MDNPVIQTDLAEVLGQINQKLDKLTTDVTELKVGQAEIKGGIKAVDEKLSGQIKALDTKVEQLLGSDVPTLYSTKSTSGKPRWFWL